MATVSIPQPAGVLAVAEIPTAQLIHVAATCKDLFRQITKILMYILNDSFQGLSYRILFELLLAF